MSKKIVFCHGDKGGVGKSVLAAALVDIALDHGPVALIEGDLKIRDLARRYEAVEGVTGYLIDLARPDSSQDAAIVLFDALERAGLPDCVIINLPASASGTVDQEADVIKAAATDMGYSIRVGWMLGAGEDSARLAAESALCRIADRKVAIHNAAFGPITHSTWPTHPARAGWRKSGGLEVEMPALAARVMSEIRDRPGRFAEFGQPAGGLTIISRQIVVSWRRAMAAGPCKILLED